MVCYPTQSSTILEQSELRSAVKPVRNRARGPRLFWWATAWPRAAHPIDFSRVLDALLWLRRGERDDASPSFLVAGQPLPHLGRDWDDANGIANSLSQASQRANRERRGPLSNSRIQNLALDAAQFAQIHEGSRTWFRAAGRIRGSPLVRKARDCDRIAFEPSVRFLVLARTRAAEQRLVGRLNKVRAGYDRL